MRIIDPSFEILTPISEGGLRELKLIEKIGRVCYKSENKISENGESAKQFVAMLIKRGHEAMIEHSFLSVKFTIDRGVSHEIVRHRLAAFAQESTRYCNYAKDKFEKQITFIRPFFFQDGSAEYKAWERACLAAEKEYLALIESGASPQQARSVLPNSLKTELVMSANYREWRHFFRLRLDAAAHPQMRQIVLKLGRELKQQLPIIFDEFNFDERLGDD